MFYMILDVGNGMGYELHLAQWKFGTDYKFLRESDETMEILTSYLIVNPEKVDIEREVDDNEFILYWQGRVHIDSEWCDLPFQTYSHTWENNQYYRQVAILL